MKKLFASCAILSLFGGMVLADFPDVKYSWYRDSILQLQTEGIIGGYADGTFGPDQPITRAEILKMMLGASKIPLPPPEEETCFSDVKKTDWYFNFVCGANKLKIAQGYGNGKFIPSGHVTSLEALAFGLRAFGLAPEATGDNWSDAYKTFSQANNLLATHVYNSDTEIHRGQVAELITRLQQYAKIKSPISYKSKGCSTFGTLAAKNTIMINDVAREYNLALPSNYSSTKEYSLVVASHGRTNSKDQVQGYMGLDRGQTDYIIAYPAGLPSGSAFSWSEKESLTFFDAMIQEISENYCVNRDRVFLVGHSLGGWFANKLACVRGDVVHGMATVGATPFTGACTGPVASLIFQREDDKLVSYESGKQVEAFRKKVNQCSEHSTTTTIGGVTCTVWDECSGTNTVTWCEGYQTYGNDAHSWPTEGSGRGGGSNGGAWMLEWFGKLK